MTIKLDLKILDRDDPPAWPELAENTFPTNPADLKVAILRDGMTSGKTSVALLARIVVAGSDVDDPPAWVCIETSASVIHALAGAIRGADQRWSVEKSAEAGSVETSLADDVRRVFEEHESVDELVIHEHEEPADIPPGLTSEQVAELEAPERERELGGNG